MKASVIGSGIVIDARFTAYTLAVPDAMQASNTVFYLTFDLKNVIDPSTDANASHRVAKTQRTNTKMYYLKLAALAVLVLGGPTVYLSCRNTEAKAQSSFTSGVNQTLPVAVRFVEGASKFVDWVFGSAAGHALGNATDTALLAGANPVANGWDGGNH